MMVVLLPWVSFGGMSVVGLLRLHHINWTCEGSLNGVFFSGTTADHYYKLFNSVASVQGCYKQCTQLAITLLFITNVSKNSV